MTLSLTELHPTIAIAAVATGWIALIILESVAGPTFEERDGASPATSDA